jgi:putative iron-dependent peroxidase
MPKPQGAICPESGDYGVYLTLTLLPGTVPAALRKACASLPALTKAVAKETGEKSLLSAVAVGKRAWPRLFGGGVLPRELEPFKTIRDGKRVAPGTPADIFVHINANHQDANFILARRFMAAVRGTANLVEEVHGFRHLRGRDLTGFVDGTENPKGADVPKAALVGAEDSKFAGGSYVSIQRYLHDLKRWEARTVAEQENTIGRTKKGDVEMSDRRKPPTAHIARVVIEENGKELEIVRRSLPYGTATEAGLYFIAYGRTPENFRKMLTHMIRHDHAGHYDHLTNFVHAVTGANFFAPSVEFLKRFA